MRIIPNLAVMSLLVGVFLIGHRNGWKLPKLAAYSGSIAPKVDDWCEEHLVPESKCVECKRSLFARQKEFGFCKIHGVAECVIDHPELAQVSRDVNLPKYDTARAISLLRRAENNSRSTLHKTLVQFASAESADKAGIEIDVVQERPMHEVIVANGELQLDPRRVAHLAPRASGTVAAVFKTLGESVLPGEIIALVDSATVGQAKSRLLQSIVKLQLNTSTASRLQKIAAGGAVAQKLLIEAESALKESEIDFLNARQTLANLGFEVAADVETCDPKTVADELQLLGIPASAISHLGNRPLTANLLPVRSPFEGAIVAADVALGEVVDASNAIVTVADPTTLWLILNLRQEDAAPISEGLPVEFQPDDRSQHVYGYISWISPEVDAQTRTLQVRAEIENRERRLKDKTFGTGRIVLRQEENAIVVPRLALQSTADAHFVFVRDKDYLKVGSPKVFHVRQVRMGAQDGDYLELLAGVLPGEVIATKGSGALLAQLLRSSFGAGCGCCHIE